MIVVDYANFFCACAPAMCWSSRIWTSWTETSRSWGFNIFSSLAEFERNLIRERGSDRLRGLSKQAKATAMAAVTLYQEGELSM